MRSTHSSSDEKLLPRHVEIKVLDPESGALVFRSEQPAAVTPGGQKVLLKLRKIPYLKDKTGQPLELKSGRNLEIRLVDVDNEEILDRKTVTRLQR